MRRGRGRTKSDIETYLLHTLLAAAVCSPGTPLCPGFPVGPGGPGIPIRSHKVQGGPGGPVAPGSPSAPGSPFQPGCPDRPSAPVIIMHRWSTNSNVQ